MLNNAGVAKLVDASALGADGRKTVKVRVLSPAPVRKSQISVVRLAEFILSQIEGLGD